MVSISHVGAARAAARAAPAPAAIAARHLAAVRERVAAAGLLEAVSSTSSDASRKSSAVAEAALLELVEHPRDALEVVPPRTSHTTAARSTLLPSCANRSASERDHLRRQVVDAEVAGVLEARHRLRLARAGEAGDHRRSRRSSRTGSALGERRAALARASADLVDVLVDIAGDLPRNTRNRLEFLPRRLRGTARASRSAGARVAYAPDRSPAARRGPSASSPCRGARGGTRSRTGAPRRARAGAAAAPASRAAAPAARCGRGRRPPRSAWPG